MYSAVILWEVDIYTGTQVFHERACEHRNAQVIAGCRSSENVACRGGQC